MVQQLTTRAEEVSDEVDHVMSSISLLFPKEQNKILWCDRFAMTSFHCCFNSSVPTRVGPTKVPLFPGNKCVLESSGGQTNCLVGSSWLHTSIIVFPGDENGNGHCKDDPIEELWKHEICITRWQKKGVLWHVLLSCLYCPEKFNPVKIHIPSSSPQKYQLQYYQY